MGSYFLGLGVVLLLSFSQCEGDNATNDLYDQFAKSLNSRIFGGEQAQEHQFPSAVSLRWANDYVQRHFCGGNIISERWVVTAAHCVDYYLKESSQFLRKQGKYYSIVVMAGETHQVPLASGKHLRNVSQIILHPRYQGSISSDLAVLRVEPCFVFVPGVVEPIAIIRRDMRNRENCIIAGWGKIDQGPQSLSRDSQDLLFAKVYYVGRNDCNIIINSPRDKKLPVGTICAGDLQNKAGACYGDSGSGLMCSGQLVGVTSTGYNECRSLFGITMYTELRHFEVWLRRIVDSDQCPRKPLVKLSPRKENRRSRAEGPARTSAWMIFLLVSSLLIVNKSLL